METAYIRLKFTPVIKYLPKANLNNCMLEIIPSVSCIQNLEKLEWSRQKDVVEYIVPMTYKIILKRRTNRPSDHQLRVYYSCIDLISAESCTGFSAGDVHRHISDNFILSKANNENFKIKLRFDREINSKKNDIKSPNDIATSTVACLPISKVKLTENINVQGTNTRKEIKKYKRIGNDSFLQENRTVTENKINRSNINEISYTISQEDDKKRDNLKKRLCITKVCKINTTDDISLCNRYVKTELNTPPSLKPSVCTTLNYIRNKNIECMENIHMPFRNTLLNCFVRVEPEIRIAQFVDQMEKEVFPLKVLLNDILSRCATLGLNVSGVKGSMSIDNKCYKKCNVHNNLVSNRVVYSIVFDN